MASVRMIIGDVTLTVVPRDTATAQAILDALPFTATARTWGDEVYFDAPVSAPSESDATDTPKAGEIAFWLAGSCIAIAWGPTPASHGVEIRLASPANVWGDAVEDVSVLRSVPGGATVRVEAAD